MKPRAFASVQAFRAWLERHHASRRELIVRCFKVHASDRGLTYRQALDEALCFGWIDGVRRALDRDSFSTRFTPRKPKSYWSVANRKRARELAAEGRLHAAGLAALPARASAKPDRYSFEARSAALTPAFERRLRERPRARAFLDAQPPWYRRTSVFWVMSAKKEETRERRFRTLVDCCERQRTIPPLTRPQRAPGGGR
ncbi:MAG: YdeI/OmpD-associated family protein [Betaproteobacteria bacterium]